MWKSAVLLRAAMNFYPQPCCESFTAFHRVCGRKFFCSFIHRNVFHIPQALWIKDFYVTFLSLNKKVTKELSQRVAFYKDA